MDADLCKDRTSQAPLDAWEIGEVIDIIKKNGAEKAVEDHEIKNHLIEEMADVLMYYNDVLRCCDISEEELKQAYIRKFEKNMKRW